MTHGAVPALPTLRSLLFVPGNQVRMLRKALDLAPDAYVPDLEDSVPDAEKDTASGTKAWSRARPGWCCGWSRRSLS